MAHLEQFVIVCSIRNSLDADYYEDWPYCADICDRTFSIKKLIIPHYLVMRISVLVVNLRCILAQLLAADLCKRILRPGFIFILSRIYHNTQNTIFKISLWEGLLLTTRLIECSKKDFYLSNHQLYSTHFLRDISFNQKLKQQRLETLVCSAI